MSPPRGSLGFLNAEGPRGIGRIGDRLWLGCPDRGQFALAHSEADDCELEPEWDPQPLTQHGPSADSGAAGHVPRRRHRRADVLDERSRDRRPGAL